MLTFDHRHYIRLFQFQNEVVLPPLPIISQISLQITFLVVKTVSHMVLIREHKLVSMIKKFSRDLLDAFPNNSCGFFIFRMMFISLLVTYQNTVYFIN